MEVIVVLVVSLAVISFLFRLTYQRYTGPGEDSDFRNMEAYGKPEKSLYTSSEVFTLHHRIEITDDAGNVAYCAETQFPSIHDKTDIYAADGRHVAYFERKLISLHEIHYVDMENGRSFTLSNELMHLIKDVTNIEGLGWIIDGNILQLNFTIKDEKGELLAVVNQKAFSIHDKFAIDIYKPEHEEEIVAVVITLQHMVRDRESNASASGGSASSGQ